MKEPTEGDSSIVGDDAESPSEEDLSDVSMGETVPEAEVPALRVSCSVGGMAWSTEPPTDLLPPKVQGCHHFVYSIGNNYYIQLCLRHQTEL